jgi:O-acetyl-ADP-ribose deacetylase (regulator of RNase III)
MAEQCCAYVRNPKGKHQSWLRDVHSPKEHDLKKKLSSKGTSITFPCISTGSYSFPVDKAAKIAISSIVDFAKNCAHDVREIRISCAKGQKDIHPLLNAMKAAK